MDSIFKYPKSKEIKESLCFKLIELLGEQDIMDPMLLTALCKLTLAMVTLNFIQTDTELLSQVLRSLNNG
jgi:hypothetical protein